MWLAIDIGNTNIHIGIFEEDVLQSAYTVTVKSEYPPQANFIKVLNPATLYKAQAVVLASVNPKAEAFVIGCIRKHLLVKPQSIGKEIPIPIPILTDRKSVV